MRIHIMGLGSVGSLVGFHLRRTLNPSVPITLLHKTTARAMEAQMHGHGTIKVENRGVMLTSIGFDNDIWDEKPDGVFPLTRDHPLPKSNASPSENSVPHLDQSNRIIRSLIVATKAYSVTESLRALTPRLTASSTIVLLQNGMGLYEEICNNVFPNPLDRPHIVIAVNNHGAWIKSYMHIVHAAIGNIKLAIMPDGLGRDFEATYRNSPDPHTAHMNLDDIFTSVRTDVEGERYYSLRYTMQAFLQAEGLYASWLPLYDLQLAQLRKLVVNSVINPLTTILGCRNGEIFNHPSGRHIAQQVCREASAAFQAEWQAERDAATRAAGHEVDSSFPEILKAPALFAEVERIVKSTEMNISSMLADIRKSRPTELKYLNGYLLGMGQKHKIWMPTNRLLAQLLNLRQEIPLRGLL